MKKIYMAQPNSQYGNSIYLPYAVGSLVAYAFSDETVKSEYTFEGFIYKREDIESVISRLDDPFLVGFSCYVWNYEYNKKLALRIKDAFPECKIVFGGHQISAKCDVLNSDYVDFCLLGEGEESFKKLLLYLAGSENIENVPGLLYRTCNGFESTLCNVTELSERVSPYLTGYFDELVEKEKLEFSAIIETNRGCPNRCAFCDWGNIKSRVKLFDMELIKAEINWLSEKKIEFCFCADANFGMFARDIEIVDYVVYKNNQNGYPQKFQVACSKTNPKVVFEINKRLNEAGVSKGATLSFQSMSQDVLENIHRKNMPLVNFLELMSMYNSNGIPAYSEIIIGLPGETYESFRCGIDRLLECGQHMAISFFNCEVLGNSTMASEDYIEKYNIQCADIEQHQYHVVPKKDGVPEYSRIIISTNSMSKEEWIDCNILQIFVRALHNLGLLQCVAIFLYYEKNIKYTDFYCNLISWAKDNVYSILGEIYTWLKNTFVGIANSEGSLTYFDPSFGEVTWPLEEATFLKIIKNHSDFYKEISPLLMNYIEDEKLFNELMSYQNAVVKKPFSKSDTFAFSYDFYDYFKAIYANEYNALNKVDVRLKFNLSHIPQNFVEYAKKIVWYGRRGGQIIVSDVSYVE